MKRRCAAIHLDQEAGAGLEVFRMMAAPPDPLPTVTAAAVISQESQAQYPKRNGTGKGSNRS